MAIALASVTLGSSQAFAKGAAAVVPAREAHLTVRRDALLEFPLYDGQVMSAGTGLLDLGVVRLGTIYTVSVAGHRAQSSRAQAFRVLGKPGTAGVVTVRLRLPDLTERCVSCRTIHYFYTIK